MRIAVTQEFMDSYELVSFTVTRKVGMSLDYAALNLLTRMFLRSNRLENVQEALYLTYRKEPTVVTRSLAFYLPPRVPGEAIIYEDFLIAEPIYDLEQLALAFASAELRCTEGQALKAAMEAIIFNAAFDGQMYLGRGSVD